jgi:hypothetical protein
VKKYDLSIIPTLSRCDLEKIVADLVHCLNDDRIRDHVFSVGSPGEQAYLERGFAPHAPEWHTLKVLEKDLDAQPKLATPRRFLVEMRPAQPDEQCIMVHEPEWDLPDDVVEVFKGDIYCIYRNSGSTAEVPVIVDEVL